MYQFKLTRENGEKEFHNEIKRCFEKDNNKIEYFIIKRFKTI